MNQKSIFKKILTCSSIICILAAGVVFITQQQKQKNIKSNTVTIFSGDEPGVYVDVDCYPILQGQIVKVEDQKMIAALSDEIDGKVFSYLGSRKILEKKFENMSGGYYSNFSAYSENGSMLYSFGYSGVYNGYIVSRNSYIYHLDDDEGLNEICNEIIKLAKKQIEKSRS